MKTFITTAIAAIMFTCIGNAFANNDIDVHGKKPAHKEMVCMVTPACHCICKTCEKLVRKCSKGQKVDNIKATKHCECPTCRDIRHYEQRKPKGGVYIVGTCCTGVAHPAMKGMPVATRVGADVISGRR